MKPDMLFCQGRFKGGLFMLKEEHKLHCLEIESWRKCMDIKQI